VAPSPRQPETGMHAPRHSSTPVADLDRLYRGTSTMRAGHPKIMNGRRLGSDCTYTQPIPLRWKWLQYAGAPILGSLGELMEDPLETQRNVTASWCVEREGTSAWLATVRLAVGALVPGKRFINEHKGHGDEVPATDFWRIVQAHRTPNDSYYATAGYSWAMLAPLRSAASSNTMSGPLEPLAYPPLHMHHLGMRWESAYMTSHADTYCAEREDHCLWWSLPRGHGYLLPYGSNINLYSYVETLASLSCPQLPFPQGELVLESTFRIQTGRTRLKQPQRIGGIMPFGHPSDLARTVNVLPWAPHIAEAPRSRYIVQWQSCALRSGYILPQDESGFVKMHTHSAHLDVALLFGGAESQLGLDRPPFIRRRNRHGQPVPLMTGGVELGGLGLTQAEVKACLLDQAANGMLAAKSIKELEALPRCPLNKSETAASRPRLLCAWTGSLSHNGLCNREALLYDGFDRRENMIQPEGGDCHPSAASVDNGKLTWVYFNRATSTGPNTTGHHATFYGLHVE